MTTISRNRFKFIGDLFQEGKFKILRFLFCFPSGLDYYWPLIFRLSRQISITDPSRPPQVQIFLVQSLNFRVDCRAHVCVTCTHEGEVIFSGNLPLAPLTHSALRSVFRGCSAIFDLVRISAGKRSRTHATGYYWHGFPLEYKVDFDLTILCVSIIVV